MTGDQDQARIIIVGGGPVGLVAALRLGLANIPVTLLEADLTPPRDLRASTFHPPTLDMLDQLDLAQALIARGLISPTWQIRLHATHEKAEFDLSILKNDTAHPYRLQCEQSQLCALVRDKLAILDTVEILPGWQAMEVSQTEDLVTVRAEKDGESRFFKARFLIGADGARSVVRQAMGLDFTGMTYPETTILATTKVDFFDLLPGLSNVNYVWSEKGTFSLLRLPDLWRCSLYPFVDETIEQALTPAAIEAKFQMIAPRPDPYPVDEIRPYRVHQRIVDSYQIGRIALAGDAAHLNSPSGGMGMNGGIHDAFLLTELLMSSWPKNDPSRLDSYTARRRPIALEEILAQADRNRARMQERDPGRRRIMLEDLQKISADPKSAHQYLLRSSMIAGLRKSAMLE
jgi:3-(3-hydroxy-phenyl)propionate hydroxylase